MKHPLILLIAAMTIVGSVSSCKSEGCTDAMATNYDPEASYDDRSCRYIKGCIDCLATNYDASAVSSDNSCEYENIEHLTTYSVIDSLVDPFQTVYRDTYDISISRDTCGVYSVLMNNYANVQFSDGSQNAVQGEMIGDTLFFSQQILLGPTTTETVDKITVSESKAYFRNDSIFLPLNYSDRFDPYYGFASGPIKI